MEKTVDCTRPETDAAYVTFTNGSAKKNADEFCKWIIENDMKRSQILSMTINETEIEEGDQMLTVFYRCQPVKQNELVFEDLKFEHFPQMHNWAKLRSEAASKMRGVDAVHLVQSAKNIGSCQNQFLWYAKGSSSEGSPVMHQIRREDGNWSELVGSVKDWLNRYCPPHNLISVSLYEDAHENVGKGINACIAHTAGSKPRDLTEIEDLAQHGALYELQVITGEDSEDMFKAAQSHINTKGGQEGHLVASANDSSNDGFVIIVLSWTANMEGNIREAVRPVGCMDNCTIF